MDESMDLMTTEEYAAVARTSPATVRFWRATGVGAPGFRLGRRVVYRRADVAAWIAERAAADQAQRPA